MGGSENFSNRLNDTYYNLTNPVSKASETTDHGGSEYKTVLFATYENYVIQMTTAAENLKGAYTAEKPNRNGEECKLWYRGQQNGKLPLLPPLLREKKLKESCGEWEKCPADTMGDELQDSSQNTDAGQLALLQHGGKETTLLGFTEDPRDALYYAFKKYMSEPMSNQDVATENKPALWIFSPELYNRALQRMLEKETVDNMYGGEADIASWIKNLGDAPPYLKNCSEDPDRFFLQRYVKGRQNDDRGEGICNLFNQGENQDKWNIPKHPVAVFISDVSTSGKTKASCFVAYNSHIIYTLYKK